MTNQFETVANDRERDLRVAREIARLMQKYADSRQLVRTVNLSSARITYMDLNRPSSLEALLRVHSRTVSDPKSEDRPAARGTRATTELAYTYKATGDVSGIKVGDETNEAGDLETEETLMALEEGGEPRGILGIESNFLATALKGLRAYYNDKAGGDNG